MAEAVIIAILLSIFLMFNGFPQSITGPPSGGGSSGTCSDGSQCNCNPPTAGYCQDSDRGTSTAIKGTCHDAEGSHTDSCTTSYTFQTNSVIEWFCYNGRCESTTINCPTGTVCQDGVCVTPSPPQDCQQYCSQKSQQWVYGVSAASNEDCRQKYYKWCYNTGTFLFENGCCCYYC